MPGGLFPERNCAEMLFHEVFSDLLRRQGWRDDKAFADKAGYTREAVGNWRAGRRVPNANDFKNICDALGLDGEGREADYETLEKAWEVADAAKARPGRKPAQPSTPPPTIPIPDRCWGRDTELQDLLAALITARATALLTGDGGMGKTTLAREAANHPELVKRFAHRRHEADLSSATSAAAMQDAIALALGTKPAEGLPTIQRALSGAPHLLLLDNLETPWDAEPRAVEALIAELARLPELSLVATLRRAVAPRSPRWTHRCTLEPLDDATARALFRDIAPHIPDADPLWPDLLRELAGIPLAIELVARRAEAQRDLTRIWAEWQAQGPALADSEADPGHRHASLARSIEFSLASPKLKAEGLRLFRLLGALPAGLAREDEAPLLGEAAGEAVRQLQAVGLARPREGRLDLLPPIRRHARDKHPCTEEEAQSRVRHFLELTRVEGEKLGQTGGGEALRRLTPELDNLDAALVTASSLGLLDAARAAASGYGRFAYFAGLGGAGLHALAYADDRLGEANCIKGFADIALRRSEHAAARAGYEEARPIYREVGDRLGEANCIWRLADIALERSDHGAARAGYEEARPIYREVGNRQGEANCIVRLADIALVRADHVAARAGYEEARPIYREVGDRLSEASCILGLADIALRRSDDATARAGYEEARSIYGEVGDREGEANCLLRLATIALARSEHAAARAGFVEALSIYREVGARRGEANCLQGLAAIALARSDHAAARAGLEEARPIHREVGDRVGEANCIKGLANLALARSDHAVARAGYEEALSIYREVGTVVGEALCIAGLGELAAAEGRRDEARRLIEDAIARFESVGSADGADWARDLLTRLNL